MSTASPFRPPPSGHLWRRLLRLMPDSPSPFRGAEPPRPPVFPRARPGRPWRAPRWWQG